ncbi:reprolysin-like metallopeptidase [Nocardia sp. bgisy134]|uniref:reprolysin-like metallopeptidase n=1 Tax=Nocardia sp. bgisy134 TaxID=3413789 RepID=UPI003D712818
MAHDRGAGRVARKSELAASRRRLGLDVPAPIDLNRATVRELGDQPAIGKALAGRIARWRVERTVQTPADLFHAGLISAQRLRELEQVAYGVTLIRPMIVGIEGPAHGYVDEGFTVDVRFRVGVVAPAILSIDFLFPSGAMRRAHFRLTAEDIERGAITVGDIVSGESGELHVYAKLRDADGGVHEYVTTFDVFTRNPVQIFVTPTHFTQSGAAGAPKFDFGQRRWYCYADVRWVNGEDRAVDLGRAVTVRMTDAGTEIGTFTFNLSGNIVIPARSTVYGSWHTYHEEGSAAFGVFHAKGDLTYTYSMSGSGFTPTRSQVWRTMRTLGYNIIRVGDFTANERNEYRRAAGEVASGIFRSRDMTVHGVELYRIEGTPEMEADKARFRFIDNQDEINQLRSKYTVDNWYLDVFFVEGRWDGAFGSSPVDGPVDKEGDGSGLVLRRDGDTVNLGQTFAHESGHYLGLEHADEEDGCADTDPASPDIDDNFIFSSSHADSHVITGCQINRMRKHGLVRSVTP